MAILLLTLGTAFFVAVEFALVAVERAGIEARVAEGDRRAVATMAALRSLSFQLSGAQLGITITSLVVGYLAEPLVAVGLSPLLEDLGLPRSTSLGVAVTFALVLATSIQMVLGELVPKNFAIARPIGSALLLAPPLRLMNMVLKPLILFLNGTANWTVRRLGIEPKEELDLVRSLDEIEMLIHLARKGGSLGEQDFNLLSRSIGFGGKTAADALVPRTSIVALEPAATLSDVSTVALETGHSRFPVMGESLDDLLGVVLVKDIYRFPRAEWSTVHIGRAMQQVPVVPESRDLESLLLEMRRDRKQIAIVLDEYGGTAGIITIEDLLEEIVGDIEDEYDLDDPPRTTQPQLSGVHLLSGLLHSDEVQEACGFNIPEGDYDTLAGFLLSRFERLPTQGEHISVDGWELKVVEMDRRRIAQVLAVAPDPIEDQGEGA